MQDQDHHHGRTWSSAAPRRAPFQPSATYDGVRWTGRMAQYTNADTWFPSWAADGNLYSPFTDGDVDGVESWSVDMAGFGPRTGNAVIIGDDPTDLRIVPLGVEEASADPYEGRYPSASLLLDGTWYVGTYCLTDGGRGINWDVLGPFVGFRTSRDAGRSWEPCPLDPTRPLFGESGLDDGIVRLGAPHVIDFGQNMERSPDGYAYLVGHGSRTSPEHLGWCSGDGAFLARARITPASANDPTSWEFAAGTDPVTEERRGSENGPLRWTRDIAEARPIASWPGHWGTTTITRLASGRYLMCVTDGWPGIKEMDSYILESPTLEGPWRMAAWMPEFGRQGYFLTIPSKFVSDDERRFWLCYSANFTNTFLPYRIESDPPGSTYGMCMIELELLPAGAGD